MKRFTDPGFVYVLSNEQMPLVLKIGKTTKVPEQRAAQLNSTGVPSEFIVEFAIWTPSCSAVEKQVHERLAACRVSQAREFFQCDLSDAIVAICHCHGMSAMVAVYPDERDIFQRDIDKLTEMLDMEVMDIRHLLQFIPDDVWQEAGRLRRAEVTERMRRLRAGEPLA